MVAVGNRAILMASFLNWLTVEKVGSMKEPKKGHFWRYFISILAVLILIGALVSIFLVGAIKPHRDARNQAIRTAKQYANISTISDVEQYNGHEVFYTVFGKDKSGQKIMVTINKKHAGQVYVYQADQGLTAKDAQKVAKTNGAKTIQKTTFGMAKGVPIWEVRSGSQYYLIDFKTGDLIQREGLWLIYPIAF